MNSAVHSDETRRILDLLAQGKITVDEAQQLMSALAEPAAGTPADETPGKAEGPAPRFLRITLTNGPNPFRPHAKTVNIRVPLTMIRSGIRLGSLVPGLGEALQERLHRDGPRLDFSKLDPAELERVLRGLNDLSIDVDEGRKLVQFHFE